ncbi:hypothetical protein DP939_02525 [Spongiactinospora rosea]|uniref:Uncharacterized protein n=1 Tax=Spongiactinospora rosea TaxID=2248750 RepID=A0A366M7M8_9ACTN|nr:hypothetical protein [Spongiactinospora rosea]RBQ21604.1 hypothetical protein DP939_02525 [Spongiactinospora rosea]
MSERQALEGIVEGLVVRSGDTLILHLPADMTAADMQRIAENVKDGLCQKLPDVEILMVAGIERIAVYRPGEDAPA